MDSITETKLILDYVYDHAAKLPDTVLLTQPIGGGQVVDYTWAKTLDHSRRMAAHLKSLGFPPGARIAMLAKNSAHFIMAELAIWMAGGTTVAIFPTESAENVRFVLQHSEASLLFIGKLDTWEQQKAAVGVDLPCITLPLAPSVALPDGCETWDAIVERTEPMGGRPHRGADELAMLLYTSGSTGQPKGVMQSFGNVTRATEGIVADQHATQSPEHGTRVLSYLPLAHVFERAWVECLALMSGQTHVFFSESLATFMDDIKRARPTAFISVPRLWTKFQLAVLAHMPAAQLDVLLDNPATAGPVGQKVLASLGLAYVLRAGSGSAPLPVEVLHWYRRLGLNLVEGYGMTEDFAYSHISTQAGSAPGYVGLPYPGVQVRLDSDGEILIKSPGQLVGYYKLPELSAESLTDDGFFRTGDLGEQNAQGLLKLTGRKKELFKTARGKYIAPSPIENRLNAHAAVELSMVSGSGQNQPYAVLVLDENLRPRLGDAAIRAELDGQLVKLLHDVNEQLASHERLQMLVVATEPWSIENGLLTPTMKIKRSRIEAAVEPQVKAWYGAAGPVIWA